MATAGLAVTGLATTATTSPGVILIDHVFKISGDLVYGNAF